MKGLAQIKKRNSKRIGHLRNGNYDRDLWYLKEQIYLRKNIVKKKLGNYDLGLFRGESIQKNGRLKPKGSFAQYTSTLYERKECVGTYEFRY